MGQNVCTCPEPVRNTLPQNILEAAVQGDIEKVSAWIRVNNDINAATSTGDTLLSAATTNGQIQVVKELMKHSPTWLHLNTYHDYQGSPPVYTPLWLAAANGHLDCVLAILQVELTCKPDLIGSKSKDVSAAMIAAAKNQWNIVATILRHYESLSPMEATYIFPRAIKGMQWNIALRALSCCEEVESDVVKPLLHQAYEKEQWPVVLALLQKNYRYKYEDLNRVLAKTVKVKNWEMVAKLLKMMKESECYARDLVKFALAEDEEKVSTFLRDYPEDVKNTKNGNLIVIAAGGTSDAIANLIFNGSTHSKSAVENALLLSAMNGHLEFLQLIFTRNSNYKFSYHVLSRAQDAAREGGHVNADRLLTKILDKEAEMFANEYSSGKFI